MTGYYVGEGKKRRRCVRERERVHYKKKIVINRSYYSPASAIVIYRESDLCAHLIGAVLTLAIVEETLFPFFLCGSIEIFEAGQTSSVSSLILSFLALYCMLCRCMAAAH